MLICRLLYILNGIIFRIALRSSVLESIEIYNIIVLIVIIG